MKAGHSSEQPDLMWKSVLLWAGTGPPEVPHNLDFPVIQWETPFRIQSYGRGTVRRSALLGAWVIFCLPILFCDCLTRSWSMVHLSLHKHGLSPMLLEPYCAASENPLFPPHPPFFKANWLKCNWACAQLKHKKVRQPFFPCLKYVKLCKWIRLLSV